MAIVSQWERHCKIWQVLLILFWRAYGGLVVWEMRNRTQMIVCVIPTSGKRLEKKMFLYFILL